MNRLLRILGIGAFVACFACGSYRKDISASSTKDQLFTITAHIEANGLLPLTNIEKNVTGSASEVTNNPDGSTTGRTITFGETQSVDQTTGQVPVANRIIEGAVTVIGALGGGAATQSPAGAAAGALGGNALGKFLGDAVAPPVPVAHGHADTPTHGDGHMATPHDHGGTVPDHTHAADGHPAQHH